MSHNPQCNGDETVNGEVTSTFEKIKNVMDTPSDDPLCISKISSCNFLKSIENTTNVRVIASDEIQFNAENKENDKDAKRLTSKRFV